MTTVAPSHPRSRSQRTFVDADNRRLIAPDADHVANLVALPAAAPIGQWQVVTEMLRATGAPVITTALEPEYAQQRWVQRHHKRVGTWLCRRGWLSRIAVMSAVDADRVLSAEAFAGRWNLSSRLQQLLPHGLLMEAWSRGWISAGSKAPAWEWFHTPELHHELLHHHAALLADDVATRRETTVALPTALAHLLEHELRLRGWEHRSGERPTSTAGRRITVRQRRG